MDSKLGCDNDEAIWTCRMGHGFDFEYPPTLQIDFSLRNSGGLIYSVEEICPECLKEFLKANMKLTRR
jgi:hypothetical protein